MHEIQPVVCRHVLWCIIWFIPWLDILARDTAFSYHECVRTCDAKKNIFRIGTPLNTLRPRKDGRHFPDDIFKCIFVNEMVWITIYILLKLFPKGPTNNIPALVQIMAWRRPGTSHYLNQWWLSYWRIYASLSLNEFKSGPTSHKKVFILCLTKIISARDHIAWA